MHGKPLVYLDNAATTQKPRAVHRRDRAASTSDDNANVHRGVHVLSRARDRRPTRRARDAGARASSNAGASEEIVFVRGTTEAINLVAQSYGADALRPGDEILITAMEHHSNIVPWQMVCERDAAPCCGSSRSTTRGELRPRRLREAARPADEAASRVVHVSNALGTVNPVARDRSRLAHARGVPVLSTAPRRSPHLPVDVQALDCDFYAFSGHKIFGPTGIGVLYGRRGLLEAMPP